jgi:lysozyme
VFGRNAVFRQALELTIPVIKRFEGCHKVLPDGRIAPYMCPAAVPTQGWGIVVKDMGVAPITREQADAALDAAVPRYMADALKASPILAAHPRALAAITSFVFNLGAGRYRASTLRRRVDAGDWAGAREELAKWTRGGGRVLPGLVKRRAAEAALIP